MILQALNEHYQRLLEEPDSGVAPPGYSLAEISFVLVVSKEGVLQDLYPVETETLVPEHKKRQGVNPPPYFLCDKVLYSLGIGKDQAEGVKRFSQYRDYNIGILEKTATPEGRAVINFLQSWDPEKWKDAVCVAQFADIYNKPKTLNVVYQIDGVPGYVHQSQGIVDLWNEENSIEDASAIWGQCLVSGEHCIVAKTHDIGISGIGEKANAALVSFNCDAFESYGKKQSYNAPVGKAVSIAYSKSLNYLVASKTNRVRLSDTTMVFWADKKGGQTEEKILAWCLDPVDPTDEDKEVESRRIDPVAARQAKTVLERVRAGLPTGDQNFDPDTRCYLLGLAPNSARLSVRFWQVSNFGELLQRIAQHYEDTRITGQEHLGGIISPWRALKALAVQEDSKNIPPLLGGQFMKSILSGQFYPQTLFNLAINRCRTGGEHGGVNTIRASIIKGFLKRKYRLQGQKQEEEMVSVSLNEKNPNAAYQLGRLFSLLEKVQRDALGAQINATIRDRYFGAASATPGSVFPLLMRLSRHHISKANYGSIMDKKIQDVVNQLDAFPAHLNLEEQGQFILGYYHQNQANYQKTDSTEHNSDNK